jgi:DNA-binding transcriptional ArsR family regulator
MMMLDQTLTALADPTRRAILASLSTGERRVTDIAKPFAMSLNSISKHIRVLERAELVKRTIRGREHYLFLNPAPLDEAADWLDQARRRWTGTLDRLDAVLKEQDHG